MGKHKLSYLLTYLLRTGVASYGHWGTYPLDFQLFNFSGHFRAAQTLTLDSMWLPTQKKIYWSVTLSLFIV